MLHDMPTKEKHHLLLHILDNNKTITNVKFSLM